MFRYRTMNDSLYADFLVRDISATIAYRLHDTVRAGDRTCEKGEKGVFRYSA